MNETSTANRVMGLPMIATAMAGPAAQVAVRDGKNSAVFRRFTAVTLGLQDVTGNRGTVADAISVLHADLEDDGSVTEKDRVMTNHRVGNPTAPTNVADVNCDGKNAVDICEANYLVGYITCLSN